MTTLYDVASMNYAERPLQPADFAAPSRTYLVSNCCGVVDCEKHPGIDYSELDMCPECEEHCEFILEDE